MFNENNYPNRPERMKNGFNLKELRLKKLNVGYPLFKLPHHLFDEVNLDEFAQDEENRLPLFIGTQFGVYPKLEDTFKSKSEPKIIVILSKSILSGLIAGLYIYLYFNDKLIKYISLDIQ